jgi:hypothetical protein
MAVSLALLAILMRLGTPMAALAMVLAIGVTVQMDGLGRGDFGGLIATYFHHQGVALALILAAAASAMSKRYSVAGVLLGMAAYAQPMTALHGAMIVGLGAVLNHPLKTLHMALVSAVVAAPAAILLMSRLTSDPSTELDIDLINEVYRFRAPHHYDPAWSDISVATLYLVAGWAGTALLVRTKSKSARFATGMMIAFTLLHLVTCIVYKLGIAEWMPFFILDANRSSPLMFALGPLLAIAGVWRAGRMPMSMAAALVLVIILIVNGTEESLVLLAIGAALIALDKFRWGPIAGTTAIIVALTFQFPPTPKPPTVPAPVRDVLERIRAETEDDALFVIPVGLTEFRHYAHRSAFVNFHLFSVAQPDQALLTIRRIDLVLEPQAGIGPPAGWPAISYWDEERRKSADCETMARILNAADADYFLRQLASGEVAPECSDLALTIKGSSLALYGPRQ